MHIQSPSFASGQLKCRMSDDLRPRKAASQQPLVAVYKTQACMKVFKNALSSRLSHRSYKWTLPRASITNCSLIVSKREELAVDHCNTKGGKLYKLVHIWMYVLAEDESCVLCSVPGQWEHLLEVQNSFFQTDRLITAQEFASSTTLSLRL